MLNVLVIGAGKIGALSAFLLTQTGDYHVFLADICADNPQLKKLPLRSNLEHVALDAQDEKAVAVFLKKHPVETVVSSLPYHCNVAIAKIAAAHDLNYFDLTEDTQTSRAITEIAKDSGAAFVPQCGLAPGFISIAANELMRDFPQLHSVKLRVGALPININNAFQYSLTWSTDGLINEYGNLCQAIEGGEEVVLLPLDDLEEIKIDGLTYEAFNTSGGIGTLVDTYIGKVKHLSYKTIRYPGHCNKMRLLMNDLKLNEDRPTLKRILENSIPKTLQDVVLVYVSVTGTKDNQFIEESYVRKFYPKTIDGHRWSAIQLTAASGLCAILDLVLSRPGKYRGLVRQEQFSLKELTDNRFGRYYANDRDDYMGDGSSVAV